MVNGRVYNRSENILTTEDLKVLIWRGACAFEAASLTRRQDGSYLVCVRAVNACEAEDEYDWYYPWSTVLCTDWSEVERLYSLF